MNFFSRIKNIIELSKYSVEETNLAGQPIQHPKLVNTSKPKKKLATIIQENPLDSFPSES